jgi:hypothetical protein
MSIESEIAALDGMSTAELARRYTELHGRRPRTRHRRWLQKRIGYRLQEIKFGGLSMTAKRRLDELIAELGLPFDREDKPRPRGRNGALTPGMTLTREYRGEQIHVEVLAGGEFEWRGERFKSLSAVARAVTGQHLSGPRFFAIARPGRIA